MSVVRVSARGVPAGYSRVGVPAGTALTVLAFLCARFPRIAADVWAARLRQGEVFDAKGRVVAADQWAGGTTHLHYRRMPEWEMAIPFEPVVLYQDEHLVIADKPHFLPTAPAGQYVEQTLLVRLQKALQLPGLSPLHRLDKDTAGLVMLSANPASRDAYHALFRQHAVRKCYQAVAPWRAELAQPMRHISRMEPGGPRFFTMHEVPGEANSETWLQMAERAGDWALYELRPRTGRKHQLRVHMAALGAPIRHDAFYPTINDPPPGDYGRPLQLLARELAFEDPLSGGLRVFESRRSLQWPMA